MEKQPVPRQSLLSRRINATAANASAVLTPDNTSPSPRLWQPEPQQGAGSAGLVLEESPAARAGGLNLGARLARVNASPYQTPPPGGDEAKKQPSRSPSCSPAML